MAITPTIEKDGTIGEINAEIRNGGFFMRPKIDTEGNLIKTPPGADLAYDIFKVQVLGFSIDDERRCLVRVLIHNEFKIDIEDKKKRMSAIQKHLNKIAPWIFTYGERA